MKKLNILYVFYKTNYYIFILFSRYFFLVQFQSIKRNLDIDTKLEKNITL